MFFEFVWLLNCKHDTLKIIIKFCNQIYFLNVYFEKLRSKSSSCCFGFDWRRIQKFHLRGLGWARKWRDRLPSETALETGGLARRSTPAKWTSKALSTRPGHQRDPTEALQIGKELVATQKMQIKRNSVNCDSSNHSDVKKCILRIRFGLREARTSFGGEEVII